MIHPWQVTLVSLVYFGNLASFDNRNNGVEANNRFSSLRARQGQEEAF